MNKLMKYFYSYPLNPKSLNSIIISILMWHVTRNNKNTTSELLIDHFHKNRDSSFDLTKWAAKNIPETKINNSKVSEEKINTILQKLCVVSKRNLVMCNCGLVEIVAKSSGVQERRISYHLIDDGRCIQCKGALKTSNRSVLTVPPNASLSITNKNLLSKVIPKNVSTELENAVRQVFQQGLVISRARNTGVATTIFDKKWNLDPDIYHILRMGLLIKSIKNEVTLVSSRRAVRKMDIYYRIFGSLPNHILIPKINIPSKIKKRFETANPIVLLIAIVASISWKKNSVMFNHDYFRKAEKKKGEHLLSTLDKLPKIHNPNEILLLNRSAVKI